MKVSVIVPAWGVMPYIDTALASVRAQTHGEIELLVVAPPEDGPQTLPAARAEGVARATGDWVLFLDADDWIDPDCVASMLEAVDRENADLVCAGLVREGADGRKVVRKFDLLGPNDTYNALVTKLVRREAIKNVAWDKSVMLGEDLMISAQLLARARRIAVLDKAFYHYRQNPHSVTHRRDGARRVRDLARVGALLREALPGAEHGDFHDRVTRDAMLLWIRYRLMDRKIWRELRGRLKGGLLSDPRHGFLKKGALFCASCLFD